MKSILLDVRNDPGLDARLQTALDLARLQSGHLTCVHSTPSSAFVAYDTFGGIFVMPQVMDAVIEQDAQLKAAVEAKLGHEDVPWDYHQVETYTAGGLISFSLLNDVIVMGRPMEAKVKTAAARSIGDVLMGARCPVLVVPENSKPVDFGATAMIAWNGSFEAAQAIRQAVPLLKSAKDVHIVCVEDSGSPLLPPLEASQYLARHGVATKVQRIEECKVMVEYELEKIAGDLGAGYLVMGAYSRSRAREFLFGGVTRYMLEDSSLPLLLAH